MLYIIRHGQTELNSKNALQGRSDYPLNDAGVQQAHDAAQKMEIEPDTYVSLRNSINASKTGDYVFHYNAPVLIVTANKKDYGNAMADSACALENMMIAANALDLGTCWINQLHWLTEHEEVQTYMKGLGLKDNETITGGLILGYGFDGLPVRTELKRTGNPVTWIEEGN